MEIWHTCIPLRALAVALTSLLALPAQAADRPAQFAVAESQILALGIRTAPLPSQEDSVRAGFPAHVVVPPMAEQVVSSPMPGLVTQLLVQQNQSVPRGAPLVRIAGPELGQMQLQLLQAAARATLARQAAQREQQLFAEGIIAQRRVQESEAGLKEAEAALKQATAALRLGGMPAATIERIVVSGNPEESITLVAARAGIVTGIAVKTGQRVDPATALLHVVQTDSLWLEVTLPVAESANWPVGTKISVPGREVTARIVSASPTVAPGSQTVVLRAAIDGKAGRVRPGEFVTVEMPASAGRDGRDVPLAAVTHDGNQAYVFVRTSAGFEARPVNVVTSAGQRVRVQGVLKPGEQIAVSGVVALKGAWLDSKESK